MSTIEQGKNTPDLSTMGNYKSYHYRHITDQTQGFSKTDQSQDNLLITDTRPDLAGDEILKSWHRLQQSQH